MHRPRHRLEILPRAVIARAATLSAMLVLVVAVLALPVARSGDERVDVARTMDAATLPQSVGLRRVDGLFVVDVAIGDGSVVVPMLFDTGGHTMIDRQLIEPAGARARGAIATISATGERATLATVTVPELRLGSVTFTDLTAIAAEIGPGHPLEGLARGIIGADLMAGLVWQLDPSSSRLTIASSSADLGHVRGAIAVPFVPASRVSPSPRVIAVIGGEELPIVVDTGSNGPLIVHPADLEGGVQAEAEMAAVATWSGTIQVPYRSLATDVALAGGPPRPTQLITTQSISHGLGLMGTQFLDGYVLTIDWPMKHVYLDPVEAETRLRPQPRSTPDPARRPSPGAGDITPRPGRPLMWTAASSDLTPEQPTPKR